MQPDDLLNNIKNDLLPLWKSRLNFENIVLHRNVPRIFPLDEPNPDYDHEDPFSQKYQTPNWLDFNSFNEFIKQFNKDKYITQPSSKYCGKDYLSGEELFKCYLDVSLKKSPDCVICFCFEF